MLLIVLSIKRAILLKTEYAEYAVQKTFYAVAEGKSSQIRFWLLSAAWLTDFLHQNDDTSGE
jgi:hypothetical protein